MTYPASAISSCAVCSKPAPLKCSRCKSLHYCSTECQKKDFKLHKIICKVYFEFDMNTRPSPNHHLAFVFPEAPEIANTEGTQSVKAELKLVWIESEYEAEFGKHIPDYKQTRIAMRDGPISLQPVGFMDNKLEPTSQDRHMMLWCDEDSQCNPTPRNPTIDKIIPGTNWRGPVLFQTGFGDDYLAPTEYLDMKVGDMSRIQKFFRDYPFNGMRVF